MVWYQDLIKLYPNTAPVELDDVDRTAAITVYPNGIYANTEFAAGWFSALNVQADYTFSDKYTVSKNGSICWHDANLGNGEYGDFVTLSATTPLNRGGRGSNGLLTIDGDVQINGTISSTGTTIGGGSSSSVDWSDITNAPSIPSFAGYSESDLGDGDLHVTISGGNGSTSNDGVSITASGNGTVFVGGNDTTIDADADLTLSAGSSITANKEITTSSDERLKNIKSLLNPDIAEIAKPRIVIYSYKDNTDNTYLGTIAQDWENIFPDAVKDGKDGYKTFAYQSAALASAVTAAREIVKLKTENAELKQRLDAIEARLQALENN